MRITTIGEILLDMTQTRVENGIPHFAANPGGAPAMPTLKEVQEAL